MTCLPGGKRSFVISIVKLSAPSSKFTISFPLFSLIQALVFFVIAALGSVANAGRIFQMDDRAPGEWRR